jgi:hypothetical protein
MLGVSTMTRLFSFIIAIGSLTSCATPEPNLLTPFSVGMTREQVRKDLKDSRLLIATPRPTAGWSSRISPPAGSRAARFERSHACVVGACDVYWVGHADAPRTYDGISLTYFYFDRDDELIGFDTWVID